LASTAIGHSQLTAPWDTELQFAGAEQWSFAMKKKTSLKDLTQFLGFVAAAANAGVAIFDFLSKVVNYGTGFREFPVFRKNA
jgi:hypothetical protein